MDSLWILVTIGAVFMVSAVFIFFVLRRGDSPQQALRPAPTDLPEKGVFFLQVHGITKRQGVLRKCVVGEEVGLIPEPDNRYDPSAIKVCRLNGEQLGYIPADHSAKMSAELTSGWCFRVTIDEIYAFAERSGSGCRLRFGVLRHSRRTEEAKRRKSVRLADAQDPKNQ